MLMWWCGDNDDYGDGDGDDDGDGDGDGNGDGDGDSDVDDIGDHWWLPPVPRHPCKGSAHLKSCTCWA